MDINQKLRERKIKFDLQKKHKKEKVFKQYFKDTRFNPANNKISIQQNYSKLTNSNHKKINNIASNSKDDFINKYENIETKVMSFNQQFANNDFSINKPKVKNSLNACNKENFNSIDFKKDKIQKQSEVKNNSLNTKTTLRNSRKAQHEKLSRRNKFGQPILKNKIEFLFNKISKAKDLTN